jgi:uncharacterized membrane protein YgcG
VSNGAPRGSGVDRLASLFPGCYCFDERSWVEVVVLVRWALVHLVGAALAVALPCSLAATVLSQAQLCGGGGASARGTGAPSGSGVGTRTPLVPWLLLCFGGCSCGGGGAGAVGTGAPSRSGVGRRTPVFPGCFRLDKRSCGG